MTVQFVAVVLTLLILSFIAGGSGETFRGSLRLMLGLLDSCTISRNNTYVTAVQSDEDTVAVG